MFKPVEYILIFSFVVVLINADPKRVKFNKVVVDPIKNDYTIIKNSNLANNQDQKILIAVIVKNHEHSLPTFLATLETLECPNLNKKCDLWIIFDKCKDASYEIFTNWLAAGSRGLFDSIIMINTFNDQLTKEKHPELDSLYFSSNLKLRALKYAFDKSFNYIFFLKADAILINSKTIEILINKNKTIVAPLLTSGETKFSNYWVTERTEETDNINEYLPIYLRKNLGCFKVYGIRDSYLVDLSDTNINYLLDIDNMSIKDDDSWLSFYAKVLGILPHVCNREIFGYIPDIVESNDELDESFSHLQIEHLLKGPNKTYNSPLPQSKYLAEYVEEKLQKPKTKFGFDEIYVVNLERRSDRREVIKASLNYLGVSFKLVKAIDGKAIDDDYIKNLGISVLPGYKDPYNDRTMNYGEIGCFLSHYFIWKEMVEKNYQKIIIFEDDAKFALGFKTKLNYFIKTMKEQNVEWELLYLGRKIMKEHADEEFWENKVEYKYGHGIIKPSYTHWTIAYALTLDGAKKLLKQEPLKNILPVDEYLPIMFNRQPNTHWASFYKEKDLQTFAIQPSIVSPTHYTGDPNHVSDTEQTNVLNEALLQTPDLSGNDFNLNIEYSKNPHIEL